MARHIGLLLILLCCTTAIAGSPKDGLSSHWEYLARGGGEWRSDNKDYTPETKDTQPQFYGYRYEWSLGGQVLRCQIFGTAHDGKRYTFWENVSGWHPTAERGILQQFGSEGAIASGTIERVDANTIRVLLMFVMASGEMWSFKEIDTILGPDEFRTASYRFKEGKWVESGTSVWRRVKPAGNSSRD